jgi:DNA-binding MarR family transcriptional regulator
MTDIGASNIDSKIVASLERIAQAFRVLLWEASKEYGLSPIQVQVLAFLLNHPEKRRKASALAAEFDMTKPTISNTLKILEEKGLIKRFSEPQDTRSAIIHLTEKGRMAAAKTSGFAKQLREPVARLYPVEKDALLHGLLIIIEQLNRSGVITVQRMCLTCSHYRSELNGQKHFCRLLNKELAVHELRIDCPEHEPHAL